MRRLFVLLLLLPALPAPARASWAYVGVEELVQESDLIVVGTLRDVTEHTAGEVDYGLGRIEVREVIWGSVSPGDSLLLKWSNPSGTVCPRVENEDHKDKEGVWLLTREGEAVAADHPGRFVGPSERRRVEAALARSPVVLRAESYRVERGGPMSFAVVYRNVSNVPREFPGLAFEGRDLRVSPGTRLAVAVTLDEVDVYGVARLKGRVVRDRALAPVTVPPGGERRVGMDLRRMLVEEPAENSSYNVIFRFGGLPPTNDIDFHVGEPLSLRPAAPPVINYSRPFKAPAGRRGLAPLKRAGLTAVAALLLFPLFRRLRAASGAAGLARAANGVKTWQI